MIDFKKHLAKTDRVHILPTIPAMGHDLPPVVVDFEGYYDDECSVTKLGVWAYTHHPKFNPYLAAIYDGENEFVGHPKNFEWKSLEGRLLVSHNRTFDYSVYLRCVEVGWADPVDFAEWACSADLSCYLKAGRSLKAAAKNLLHRELSKDVRKLMKGLTPEEMHGMILVFKGKNLTAKLDTMENVSCYPDHDGRSFYDMVVEYASSDSVNAWQIWVDYADQWPEFERRLSLMTGRSCIKGFMIDRKGLNADIQVLRTEMDAAKARLPWSQDLEPGSDEGLLSIPRLQGAIRELGLEPPSTTSEDALELQEWEKANPECQLTVDMRNFRKAGILIKRCQILVDRANPATDRFSYAMRYGGADRTLRWAGGSGEKSGGWNESGFNVHNFPKEPLYGVDLRHRVIAPKGKKLIIADAAQIEPRCTAWLTNDEHRLDLMRQGISPYQIHAENTMGWAQGVDLKSADKKLYQLAKIRVLGLSYGCGHVKFRDFAASQYKYFMTLVESKRNVNEFRKKERKIMALQRRLQSEFQASIGGNYEIELPTGRTLTYYDVQPHGHDWVARRTMDGRFLKYYGGILMENLVQATAREVFGFMLCNLEDAFGDVNLFHVHDETILEVDPAVTVKEVEEVMAICPPWMEGLPVAAEAQESLFYCK